MTTFEDFERRILEQKAEVFRKIEDRSLSVEFVESLPSVLKDDRDLMCGAIVLDSRVYLHASDRLKGDPQVVSILLASVRRLSDDVISCIPQRFREDWDFILPAIERQRLAFVAAADHLRDDWAFVEIVVYMGDLSRGHWEILGAVSERIRADASHMIVLLCWAGNLSGTHQYAAKDLWDNEQFLIQLQEKANMRDQEILKFASDRICDDANFLLKCRKHGCTLRYASARLLDDKEFAMGFLNAHIGNNRLLCYFSDRLRDDRDVLMSSFRLVPWQIISASSRLKNDAEIILHALQKCGEVLDSVPNKWKDHHEAVLTAVKSWGFSLSFASDRLKDNKEVVLAAVRDAGLALECASPRLQDDDEVVIAAVQEQRVALKCASERLQNSCQIVQTALTANYLGGNVLRFAGPMPRQDKETVLIAVNSLADCIEYANNPLKLDPEVVLTTLRRKIEAWTFPSLVAVRRVLDNLFLGLANRGEFVIPALYSNSYLSKLSTSGTKRKRSPILDTEFHAHQWGRLQWHRIFLLSKIGSSDGTNIGSVDAIRMNIIQFSGLAENIKDHELLSNYERVINFMISKGLHPGFAQ